MTSEARDPGSNEPGRTTQGRDLFTELRELTQHWTRHDLDLPREEASVLGWKLYRLGGEQMMQDAYYYCTMINPAASILSAFWDGIGEWKW